MSGARLAVALVVCGVLMAVVLAMCGLLLGAARAEPSDGELRTLVKQLDSRDEKVRREALWRLGTMDEQAAPAVPRLIRLLAGKSRPTAALAQRVLRRIGAPAATSLLPFADEFSMDDPRPFAARAILTGLGADALPALATLPPGKDPFARSWAVEDVRRLARAGQPMDAAVTGFAAWLQAPPSVHRLTALRFLAAIGPPAAPAAQQIVALLRDPDPEVRAAAATVLGQTGAASPGTIDALTAMVEHEQDLRVLSPVGQALCQLGKPEAGTRALWRSLEGASGPVALGDEKAMPGPGEEIQYAPGDDPAEFLAEVGPPVLPAVIERLASPDERTRYAAIDVLRSLRSLAERGGLAVPETAAAAVPALADLLNHPSPAVRLTAVQALGVTGEAGTQTLIGCLTHEDPQVRKAALSVLSGRPAGLAYVMPLELRALRRGDAEQQSRAIDAISNELCWQPQDVLSGDERQRLLEVTDEIARELGRIVREGPPDLRRDAAQTLRLIEPLGASGVPALVGLLASEEPELRAEGADGLGWIGLADDYVIDALVPVLDDRHEEARNNAYVSLGALGRKNARAVATLIPRLSARDVEVRRRAASALGRSGAVGRPAAPSLVEALGDADPQVRAAAAESLASVTKGSDEGVSALVKALDDPQLPVRVAAAESLGELGSDAAEAIPAMVKLFEASRLAYADESLGEEKAREFLDVCYEVMYAFGDIGEAAVPALVDIVVGPDEHLGDHAAAAFWGKGDAAEAALAEHLTGSVEIRLRAAGGFERLAYHLTSLGSPERSPLERDAAERQHLEALMARHPALAEAVCLRHMHNLCARAIDWTDQIGAGITLDRFWFVDVIGLDEPYLLWPEDARCPLAGDETQGYALNRAVAWLPVSRIVRPAETVLFFEADLGGRSAVGGPDDAVARHDGRVAVGFCDGHVDTLPLEAARELLGRQVP